MSFTGTEKVVVRYADKLAIELRWDVNGNVRGRWFRLDKRRSEWGLDEYPEHDRMTQRMASRGVWAPDVFMPDGEAYATVRMVRNDPESFEGDVIAGRWPEGVFEVQPNEPTDEQVADINPPSSGKRRSKADVIAAARDPRMQTKTPPGEHSEPHTVGFPLALEDLHVKRPEKAQPPLLPVVGT